METITLKGKSRKIGKKADVKQLRRAGEVPCVYYGHNVENIVFSVDAKELKKITHTPKSYLINLEVDGQSYLCVFHQIQYHPVTDEALHVDFLAISSEKPVVIEVPVVIEEIRKE